MRTFTEFKADIEKDLKDLTSLDVTGADEALVHVRQGKYDLLIRDDIGAKDRETSELIIQRGAHQQRKEITWD